MAEQITIGLSRNPRKRGDLRNFRIDHIVKKGDFEAMPLDERVVFIRVGLDSIELPESTLRRLCAAVDTAFHAGMEYPEDIKPFYGLGSEGDYR